jgi:hypothetical protein
MSETRKPVLIPDPVVAKERYRVHPMTLRRWDKTSHSVSPQSSW